MRDLVHGVLALHYLPFPLVESWAHLDDARRDANSNCERRNRSINDRVGTHYRPLADRHPVENPDAGGEPDVIANVNSCGDRTLLSDGDVGRVERMIGGDDNSGSRRRTMRKNC